MSIFRPLRFLVGIFFILCLSTAITPRAQAAGNNVNPEDIQKSLEYIYSMQDPTGGVEEVNTYNPSSEPQCIQTAWAIMAFSANKIDPTTVKTGDSNPSLLDYLQNNCQPTSVTDVERYIMALSASQITISSSLNNQLESFEDPVTGMIGGNIVSTIFGVLAYKSYNHDISIKTIEYILDSQEINGGWDDGYGVESNITAQAIMALASQVPNNHNQLILAKKYLKSLQINGGGIKYDTNSWTTSSDANSNAYVIQAIIALDENPLDAYWLFDNNSILDDTSSLRQTDGSYNFSSVYGQSLPVYTTVTILPALLGQPLPIQTAQSLQIFHASQASDDTSPQEENQTTDIDDNKKTVHTNTAEINTPQPTIKQTTQVKFKNDPDKQLISFQDLSNVQRETSVDEESISENNQIEKLGDVLGSEDNKANSTGYNADYLYYIFTILLGLSIGYLLYLWQVGKRS